MLRSEHAYLVAELVRVAGPAWIMRGELAADLLNRADDRLPGRARAEPLDHPVAHAVPVAVAHPPVDPHISHDVQRPVLHGEVKERPVAPRPAGQTGNPPIDRGGRARKSSAYRSAAGSLSRRSRRTPSAGSRTRSGADAAPDPIRA